MKREGPYNRLVRIARQHLFNLAHRRRRDMFAGLALGQTWNLDDVYERTKAADQLGWDVAVVAKDSKVFFQYVERGPEAPWELR